jgi:sulfur carrier protein ThiS
MPMKLEIQVRLYEELNDFLPSGMRKRTFAHRLRAGADVAQLLAELGVPPGHVDLVLVNGDSADFSHLLKSGDFISLYPVFESLDISSLVRVRKKPLRTVRFLAGPRLIRLKIYLRSLGFDTLDGSLWSIEKLIRISRKERRILLTRDPALMEHPELTHGYLVQETAPKRQLIEVLRRFDLANSEL